MEHTCTCGGNCKCHENKTAIAGMSDLELAQALNVVTRLLADTENFIDPDFNNSRFYIDGYAYYQNEDEHQAIKKLVSLAKGK